MKKKGYLFLTVALFMMTILFLQSESKAVMTSWSAEQPPEGAKGVEKRTEYRFRDKSTQYIIRWMDTGGRKLGCFRKWASRLCKFFSEWF